MRDSVGGGCQTCFGVVNTPPPCGRSKYVDNSLLSFVSEREQLSEVKSAENVTSSALYKTNYSYSFWRHYSSEYKYTIRTTIRYRSEYEANIQYIPTRDGVLEDVAFASRPDDGVLGLKKLPVLGFSHESKVSEWVSRV